MKRAIKRTAVTALAGVMAAGMLTGCGSKKLDGTKTVATVDGTDVPIGILSLITRENQAQAEAMYASFMGGQSYSIWDSDTEDGKTYGEQAVEESLKDLEIMYILKEKAADYKVEVTDDDKAAIAEAASQFIAANSEDTLKELAVSEDQVKTYLELVTYKERIHDSIVADVDTNVTDEEAQQSSFSYVSINTSDLSDDEIKAKKEEAQKILDAMNENPDADLNETAKSVDDSYFSLDGTFDANASEDEDSDEEDSTTTSGGYPEEVLKVLRTLDDGQMGPDVIETDTGFYVVQLKEKMDKDATESKKKSIASTRQEDFYKETTEKWLDEADVTVDKKVLKTLKVTDSHKFSIVTPTPEVTEEATTTPEVTEAAEATTTPEATEAAEKLNTDSSLEVKDGDTVNIDYVGKIDGEAFDGGSTDGSGTDLVIGSGSYIDDFEDQLIGSHPGDKVEVTVTFPDDYQATDLAGKEAVFDVTVNGIYE
ncbi:FKBP-type peptidyl-prolyl cis-trans isomerase [Blautia sp. HCP28S3_G10]|uniref:FKBP-type peptidyl-prolyl cis-trans isomerase n=1 Tax=Blautia sp. HCP28S3_G10 TaxID=3438908 RepID=UPI003F8B8E34